VFDLKGNHFRLIALIIFKVRTFLFFLLAPTVTMINWKRQA
jgi:mRNA-degrading endonuclease HigB of HigAB toxin-antitoxin module